MGTLRRAWEWIVHRLGLHHVAEILAHHRVPPDVASGRKAWMYVLGTSTLVVFILQVLTGVALASKYVASPANAYESVQFITTEISYGRLLRGLHYFGASAMVILVTLHMARVFLTGSYKYPREMTWITGVGLLLFTMVMAFTGQLLRWDENGVWGVFVASQYVARVPLIGGALKELVLAGDTVGGPTLTRFFALHVVLVPLLIFAGIGVHLYLVLRHGISEPPEAGRPVDPETYGDHYEELTRRGKPYFPYVTWRETLVGLLAVLVVVVLAYAFGPRGPQSPPDPTLVPAEPKPDWFLVWYYALLALEPGAYETVLMVYLPIAAFAALLLLPLVWPRGERAPSRRPWAIAVVVLVAVVLGMLTRLGVQANWVMEFEPEPLRAEQLGVPETSQIAEGARLVREKGCQSCHSVAGKGGQFGPDLVDVAKRLPPEAIIVRVIYGYDDMPSYRGNMTAEEMAAIIALLEALAEQ